VSGLFVSFLLFLSISSRGQTSQLVPAAKQKTISLSAKESKAVLDKFYARLKAAKTLKGVQQLISEGGSGVMSFQLMKGGYAREESGGVTVSVSDGAVDYLYNPSSDTVTIMKEVPGTPFMYALESFAALSRPKYTTGAAVRKGKFNGKPAFLVSEGQMSIPGSVVTAYVDTKTYLPLGAEYAVEDLSEWYVYVDLEVDSPMSAKDFIFHMPRKAKVNDLRRLGR
jgi:outer membrane lipoprotein-sorting protein